MKISSASISKRTEADLIVLPFWQSSHKAEAAADIGKITASVTEPIDAGDFKGKEGEFLLIYLSGQPEKRAVLLGLGERDKITTEKLRRAYSIVTKECNSKRFSEINVVMPDVSSLSEAHLVTGVVEGLLLPNYHFSKLKHDTIKELPPSTIQRSNFIGMSKNGLILASKLVSICQAVYLTRDLINDNADNVTATHLSQIAKTLAKEYAYVKTTIFDKKRLIKEKFDLILAVNKGSTEPPALIIIEYRGNPKSKDHTVVIGKGITYDTGGLHLKSSGMETMKCDMSGAAICLGLIKAAAEIDLEANFTVVIPATDNCIGPDSYKLGDVYNSYLGKTIEITSTDAEGRLVLADAIAYTSKNLKPSRIIDFATLTGAIEIALGSEASGLFSNNDALADSLMRAGAATFERVWRMPLYDEYRSQLKSDVADMKNTGGRPGGSITAAKFLQEFVGPQIPWAHLDIAATAFLADGKRYLPKHATGVGVRLMIEFLENL